MREHWIYDTTFGKTSPSGKGKIVYPFVRFPKEYADTISGKKVSIYILEDDEGRTEFRLILEDDSIIRDKTEELNVIRDLQTRVSKLEKAVKNLEKL